MEDHEIYWKAASLRADRPCSGDPRPLFSTANPLGRRARQCWVSQNSSYHLAFDAIDHRFSSPSHILLENVTFGRDGQPATLVAKTVDIGLSSRQITDPLHVDTILLQNGTLNLSQQTAPLPFQADRLQLQDMALNSPGSEWNLSAQRVNGGVIPGALRQVKFSAAKRKFSSAPVR